MAIGHSRADEIEEMAIGHSRADIVRLLRVLSLPGGFEHDPEEAVRVRVPLLRELAANRESLVATHLSFRDPRVRGRERLRTNPPRPSVCHVAVDGDVFRWVPGPWEY